MDLLSIANTHYPLQKGRKEGSPGVVSRQVRGSWHHTRQKIASFVLSCEKADQSGDEHQHQHSKLIIVFLTPYNKDPPGTLYCIKASLAGIYLSARSLINLGKL